MIMQDSGGYQIWRETNKKPKIIIKDGQPYLKDDHREIIFDPHQKVYPPGKLNITPSHLIVGVQILKPNIMISLDYPVKKTSDLGSQEFEFRMTLAYNVRAAYETSQLRNQFCQDIPLYIPFQAYSFDQIDIFFELLKNMKYEGVSIPMRHHDGYSLGIYLLKYFSMGFKKIHLLGSASFEVLAVSAYFAKNFFDLTTIDSTSWMKFANNLQYQIPYDLRVYDLRPIISVNPQKRVQCNCPMCSPAANLRKIQKMDAPQIRVYLYTHNFSVTEEIIKSFFDNSDTAKMLRDFMLRVSKKKTYAESIDFFQ